MKPAFLCELEAVAQLQLHLIHQKAHWLLMNLDANNQLDPLKARGILEQLEYELKSIVDNLNAQGLAKVAETNTRLEFGSPMRKRSQ